MTRAVFLVFTLIDLSTGSPARDPAAYRLSRPQHEVTLEECEMALAGKRVLKPGLNMVVDAVKGWEPTVEERWANGGQPVDMVLTCEERDVEE